MPYIIETSSPLYIITSIHDYKFNIPLNENLFIPDN